MSIMPLYMGISDSIGRYHVIYSLQGLIEPLQWR